MTLKTLAFAAALALVALPATAHKAWLLPSSTVLSDAGWVTVDAAVSNDLFHFNHVPLRLDALAITAPDGSALQPANAATGKFRSTFDVELSMPGTYRIATVNDGLNASYTLAGETKRWRGTAEAFATGLPAGATGIKATQSIGRNETFVTVGAPTTTVFKPTGRGIELVPVTHPNDLVAGEATTFKLLLDGAPAAGLKVTVTPGARRYRDAEGAIEATTGADGQVALTWPAAGMYWMEVEHEDARSTVPQAASRRLAYVATFEVLPQ